MGVDIGTGGCKVSLIDSEGEYISSGSCNYVTYHDYPGWSEQEPKDWYKGFKIAYGIALNSGKVDPKNIVAISIDASTHNMVLLDKQMNTLRRTIMWTDQRSVLETNWLNEKYGEELFTITLQKANPTWSLPQLLWIKNNENEVFEKIKYLMFIKDYIRYKFAGSWETDYIDAQGSMLVDHSTGEWSTKICQIASIPLQILPPIKKPTDIVGNITREVARDLGLNTKVKVLVGTTDTVTECFGIGISEAGQCVIKIATAGTVNIFTNKPHPSKKSLTYSYVIPGLWYTCMATNSAAQSLRWFREIFFELEEAELETKNIPTYKLIDEKVQKTKSGSDGLIFHPYLMGERSPYWDPFLRASFTGINAFHKKEHFYRSIMEGVAFSLKDCYLEINKMRLDADEIRLIGGGAKSSIWCDILANVLNKNIIVLEQDDSSFGSAMLAGVGVGEFENFQDAINKCVKIKKVIKPTKEEIKIYKTIFNVYKQIHDRLRGIYRKL